MEATAHSVIMRTREGLSKESLNLINQVLLMCGQVYFIKRIKQKELKTTDMICSSNPVHDISLQAEEIPLTEQKNISGQKLICTQQRWQNKKKNTTSIEEEWDY
eukprot:c8428_g1_i1 orf=23-334(-)